MAEFLPDLRYAAALIGAGSEVLGFDTEMSVDHDWGPRLFIFLQEEDAGQGKAIGNILSERLPERFGDVSVSFPEPVEARTRIMTRPLTGQCSIVLFRLRYAILCGYSWGMI